MMGMCMTYMYMYGSTLSSSLFPYRDHNPTLVYVRVVFMYV